MRAATIISTKQFLSIIDRLLTPEEISELEFALATDPTAHPVISNTGGIRKARWARAGMGKRGGVRVIYYYAVSAELILLLAAYVKNEKDNLTNADKKTLRRLVEEFEASIKES